MAGLFFTIGYVFYYFVDVGIFTRNIVFKIPATVQSSWVSGYPISGIPEVTRNYFKIPEPGFQILTITGILSKGYPECHNWDHFHTKYSYIWVKTSQIYQNIPLEIFYGTSTLWQYAMLQYSMGNILIMRERFSMLVRTHIPSRLC